MTSPDSARPIVRALVISFIVAVVSSVPWAQSIDETTKPVALSALEACGRLGNEQNVKSMGFNSLEEVSKASLGGAIPVCQVKLKDLRNYTTSVDPMDLITTTNKVIYPILVNAQLRSAITLERGPEMWKATRYGGVNLTRLLIKSMALTSETSKSTQSNQFTIEIPAFNMVFTAYKRTNELFLLPIINDRRLKLTNGTPLSARDLFNRLVPVAERYNGKPM